ncbi:hypothetical protein RCL_jg21099.t1 [Rhizophagus clarus]|uniref:Uncharacterized protein n=1 Tax=Rhizophagus clarus TaxID=94130 RepID=A0A8H3QV33_9GLOM|nr:hypothetical protein RCL_jg21099.t1 [Rhizophagus clarus]
MILVNELFKLNENRLHVINQFLIDHTPSQLNTLQNSTRILGKKNLDASFFCQSFSSSGLSGGEVFGNDISYMNE